MQKRNKMIFAACTAAALVVTSSFTAFAAEPAPGAQAGLNVSSIEDMTVSEFGTNNTTVNREEHDMGHIYVGVAVTDGEIDEANSNWADRVTEEGGTYSLTLQDEVEGEGFTAVRVFGEGTVNVTGDLYVHDDGDGTYDSDFTGMGAAITEVDGSNVYVKDVNFLSEGIVRSFANVTGSNLFVEDSVLTAVGANPFKDFYEDYHNTAQTDVMISPPWVLSLQGAVRTINVLGVNPNLVIADSEVTSGGWAVLSTDGCTAPYYWLYNTSLNVLPESAGGMNSGWKILGYDEDAYGSAYAAFMIGSSVENFYGVDINGATWAVVDYGGDAYFQGLKAGETYEATDSATGDVIYTYTAEEDKDSVVNTVFGFLGQTAGTVTLREGSVFNTADAIAIYRDANVDWYFDGAELNPGNGVLVQLMDNDNTTIGGFDPFGIYLEEAPGFPTEAFEAEASYVFTEDSAVDPSKTYYEDAPDGGYREVENPTDAGTVAYYEKTTPGTYGTVTFSNGEYTGDVYNGSGYYEQAPDALDVTIAEDAVLNGDIALTSHVHGMFLNGRNVDDVIAAIDEANAAHAEQTGFYAGLDDVEYVFLDANGEVTENKDEAVALQFTKFSTMEYYLVCHVINQIYYNGAAHLDVTVNGTWKPAAASLVTYLDIAEGAHVFAEVTDLGDGSFLVVPADEEAAPGTYGEKFVYVAGADDGSSSGESENEEAEAAESEAGESEGEAAESEAGESDGESPESENGESEAAEAPAEAPQE